MPEDDEDLLDSLPDGLARKVARALNMKDTGELEDELDLIPPPPVPPYSGYRRRGYHPDS